MSEENVELKKSEETITKMHGKKKKRIMKDKYLYPLVTV